MSCDVAFSPIWERDLWLVRAVGALRPIFNEVGLTVPAGVTVKSAITQLLQGSAQHAQGECWPSWSTASGVPGIVIDRSLTHASTVLAVLAHELLHAADDCRSGHGSWFVAWARAIGLDGPVPSTHAGPWLRQRLRVVARGLGRYPEARFGYRMTPTGELVA